MKVFFQRCTGVGRGKIHRERSFPTLVTKAVVRSNPETALIWPTDYWLTNPSLPWLFRSCTSQLLSNPTSISCLVVAVKKRRNWCPVFCQTFVDFHSCSTSGYILILFVMILLQASPGGMWVMAHSRFKQLSWADIKYSGLALFGSPRQRPPASTAKRV